VASHRRSPSSHRWTAARSPCAGPHTRDERFGWDGLSRPHGLQSGLCSAPANFFCHDPAVLFTRSEKMLCGELGWRRGHHTRRARADATACLVVIICNAGTELQALFSSRRPRAKQGASAASSAAAGDEAANPSLAAGAGALAAGRALPAAFGDGKCRRGVRAGRPCPGADGPTPWRRGSGRRRRVVSKGSAGGGPVRREGRAQLAGARRCSACGRGGGAARGGAAPPRHLHSGRPAHLAGPWSVQPWH